MTIGAQAPWKDPAMPEQTRDEGSTRFSPALLHAAAVLYYVQDATQAEIADRLGTSRTTVSRLLSEARRCGIVVIDVVQPNAETSQGLAAECARALDLLSVHLAPDATRAELAPHLGEPLSAALRASELLAGDVVLVSSGKSLYAAAHGPLAEHRGVVVAPTVGGVDDPEPWYQTNEITRAFAAQVRGTPVFLHAPALPGPAVLPSLLGDPSIRQVLGLWEAARCAVVGVGAPPSSRRALPAFVPAVAGQLPGAIGDICSRFYAADGAPVDFPGSERLLALSLERLSALESSIAVALGREKVEGVLAAARAGYFNRLVTDAATATLLVRAAQRSSAA